MKRAVGIAMLLMLSVSVSRRGHAHIPTSTENEIDIESPEISHAIYGTLDGSEEQVFVVRVPFEEPFAAPFELLVPHRRSLADHRPMYAVIGPGLPAPTEDELALLPRPLPDGMGLFLEMNDEPERLVIFESFTRRTFWSSGPVALALEGEPHEIWVFSPDGTAGDFALGFGVEEDFDQVGCGELLGGWSDYAY